MKNKQVDMRRKNADLHLGRMAIVGSQKHRPKRVSTLSALIFITNLIISASAAKADIYKNRTECISALSKRGSDTEMVDLICSNIIYKTPKTQSEIDFEKEKEQLEKTTLPLEKFLKVQEEREVKRQERKRKEEEEERKQKEAERISRQEEQKRAYCKILLDDASRQFTQEEKRGVPRYWSEHYARADPQYAECKRYR